MSLIDINPLLSQMRQITLETHAPEQAYGVATTATPGLDFSSLLKRAVESVGGAQMEAGRLAMGFERGDEGVDLGQTMVAVQKAQLSLTTLAQVRNKVVDAYNSVMQMQV